MPTIYHTYANVSNLRDYLAGTSYSSNWTADTVSLRRILQSGSRRMDSYVGGGLLTSWGPYTQTRYFDVGMGSYLLNDPRIIGPSGSLMPSDKIINTVPLGSWCNAITSVTSYSGTDRATSETLTEGYANDYFLEPYSSDPKLFLKMNIDSTKSLSSGQQTLAIAGTWGWQNTTKDTTTLSALISSTTATTITVTAATDLSEGNTLLIGTEQMYVQSISGTTLTVIRGVHGSTAATHSNGADLAVYTYPEDVVQVCLDLGHIIYRDRDIGFSDRVAKAPEEDTKNALNNLDSYAAHTQTSGAIF